MHICGVKFEFSRSLSLSLARSNNQHTFYFSILEFRYFIHSLPFRVNNNPLWCHSLLYTSIGSWCEEISEREVLKLNGVNGKHVATLFKFNTWFNWFSRAIFQNALNVFEHILYSIIASTHSNEVGNKVLMCYEMVHYKPKRAMPVFPFSITHGACSVLSIHFFFFSSCFSLSLSLSSSLSLSLCLSSCFGRLLSFRPFDVVCHLPTCMHTYIKYTYPLVYLYIS